MWRGSDGLLVGERPGCRGCVVSVVASLWMCRCVVQCGGGIGVYQ